MNNLVENNLITELECGYNISYILSENSSFLSTEYKVLQSQAGGVFVRCMKMLCNGKVQLYYMTGDRKPFASMIPSLNVDSFLTIVANLFGSIISVKNNGFLACQNIDISYERIYVDATTYKVSLVYLPVSHRMYDDYTSFENVLRSELVRLISSTPALRGPKTMQLSASLSNGMLSLEDLYIRLKGGKARAPIAPMGGSTGAAGSAGSSAAAPSRMRLIAMNAPSRVEVRVDKDQFVIGKKTAECDGVVSFNGKISRTHCQISRVNGRYTIMDLNSSNGTYVNHVRLAPHQPQPIQSGDVIRMANSDFQVIID